MDRLTKVEITERNLKMAAPIEVVPKHHQRDEVCSTRPPYREGRIPKAVKVHDCHVT